MKNHKILPGALVLSALIATAAGCATGKSSEGLNATGPSVVTAKTQPSVFELDNKLKPKQTAMVYADVKDFKSNISKVSVRFLHVPIEIKMKRTQGSNWVANLSEDQLKRLAVTGQTMRYQANIVAVNEHGQTAISDKPIDISVRAPEPKNETG